jgi:hypothetical protein
MKKVNQNQFGNFGKPIICEDQLNIGTWTILGVYNIIAKI